MVIGVLLLAMAVYMVVSNNLEQTRAAQASEDAYRRLAAAIAEKKPRPEGNSPAVTVPIDPADTETSPADGAGTEALSLPGMDPGEVFIPDYVLDPDMEMPRITVNGCDYIGTLEIPALSLYLPVADTLSEYHLLIAPCRYTGSVYKGDMIIAGHNYRAHFASLRQITEGVPVRFTDALGNVFDYTVSCVEILSGDAVEEMLAGDWDMTLFTCTAAGDTRITVRLTKTQ